MKGENHLDTFFGFTMFFFILFLLICLVITLLIGIFVYRDAQRHRMNAAMWAFVAVFTPGFVGLIIYLILREDQPLHQCMHCGYPVREDYVRCPQCGSPLKNQCDACEYSLEHDWKVCPRCGKPVLPNKHTTGILVEKEKGIGKILIVLIAVPLVILIVLIAVMYFNVVKEILKAQNTIENYWFDSIWQNIIS